MSVNVTEGDAWVLSSTETVIISAVFGSVILIGGIGNILVLTIIILARKLHSVVNFCLASLAVADLLVLAFLPILQWNDLLGLDDSMLGKHFCIFINSIDRGATVCSTLIFLLIGVERYTVLCRPLKSIGMWTYKRVIVLLALIWAITVGVCVPYGYVARYTEEQSHNTTNIYCYLSSEVAWMQAYETGVFCATFFLPVPALIWLYGKMAYALKEEFTKGEAHGPAAKSARKSRAQVTRMLVALVSLFIICLLPIRIIIMIFWYAPGVLSAMDKQSNFALFWSFRIILYINHASNPIVYFWMADSFREGFKSIFCKKCSKADGVIEISRVSRTQLSSV